MKRLVSAIMFIGLAMPAFGAFDLEEWQWQASITPEEAEAGFVRVMVTPEIFDQSQRWLNDLRVLDENGELVPHVIKWGRVRDVERDDWRRVNLLNRAFQPDEYSRVTLDFGERIEKNRIRVDLSEINYRRRVLVEGSNDGAQWDVLLEDEWLVDVSLPERKFRVDTLDLPANDFRYLRLTVYNAEDDVRRIEIRSADAALRRIVGEAELTEVAVAEVSVTRDDERKETVYELDLGYRNLPVTMIQLEIGDPYFHRGFEILGRNAPTERIERKTETGWDVTEREVAWRSVRQGTFYRVEEEEEDKVSESVTAEELNARYRYLQIRLIDRDNPPLNVETGGITVLRRTASLVFDYKPEHTYRLVGGNPQANLPDYDLARAVEGVAEFDLPLVRAGTPTPLRHEPEVPPWTERHGVLVWVVLVLAVVVMVALIVGNLGKLKQGEPPADSG
jgi:hypothetical protein